uniref:Protein kinase domain-containing protein n=1 Tax=Chlamydomonas leiostraca TaxID=1034604 RepID=A0A7S0WNV5_9CHLO|mmetsp:Transcript_20534/g.52126  ORF Transcript_20534/g.52126 Transcript_20534/m.52126 type:complete len:410 (+) Transcript_20534:147-1376(+)
MQPSGGAASDNSTTWCKRMVGAAITMDVGISDLTTAISGEAQLAVKFPVTPQLYAEWQVVEPSLCAHLESTPLGSGPAPARLLSHVSSFLGGDHHGCAGEAGLHAPLDMLIRYTWGMLGDSVGVTASFSRDKTDASSATATLKRPDLTAHLNNALVLKGEEEELEAKLDVASSELLSQTNLPWNTLNFGGLPYVICYAAAGNKLNWFAQDHQGCLHLLHPTPFNLQTRTGRMHALLASVHCFKAVLSMWKVLPQSLALPLFKPLTRAHGTSVEAKEEGVVKLIKNFEGNYVHQLQLTRWEYVQQAYRIAEEAPASGLVVPLKPPSVDNRDTYMVVTQPGFVARPTSEEELLEVVMCVLSALSHLHNARLVHRDVRWENIVRAGPGAKSSWVLLDLETVWAVGHVRVELQ